MEVDGETQKSRSEALRDLEKNRVDLTDITILSAPRPQATSTVERRMYGARDQSSDYNYRYRNLGNYSPSNLEKSKNTTDDSLGILENIPSFLSNESALDADKSNADKNVDERELARKLLQRCSEFNFPNSMLDGNKENDANTQNLSEDQTPSTLLDSGQSFNLTPAVLKDQTNMGSHGAKISATSVNFEPNEITARSSSMNKSSDTKETHSSTDSPGGISFGPESAQLMAQFENEDFQSGSLMSNQLLADEISFQQNAPYGLPVATSTEKGHLSLSCFSGIIGDLDLTVDSCLSRKLSVGEFFKRKCGNIGQLSEHEKPAERPSFGVNIRSPERIGKNVPLVDITTTTIDSTIDAKSDTLLKSFADHTKERTMMSLSTIAQALKDIDNGTPRRLVDQLLMVKKQKRKSQIVQSQNLTSNTYTLPGPETRSSLPVCPSVNSTEIATEQTLNCSSPNNKNLDLSLPVKYQQEPQASFNPDYPSTNKFNTEDTLTPKLPQNTSDTKIANPRFKTIDLPAVKKEIFSNSPKNETLSKSKESQTESKRRVSADTARANVLPIKKEEASAQRSALEASISENSSEQISSNEIVEIGKNTEELQYCIVGIRREVDIELVNKSHRWIICSLSLSQIQGDKNDIEFEIAPKTMLIPDSSKIIKISVKVLKPKTPIRATINIEMSEMPTRSSWKMQHTMWFVPEEPKIIISPQTKEDELNFETTIERPSKVQSITLENKNSIHVSLKLLIIDNEGHRFQLEYPENHPNNQDGGQNNALDVFLKPSEQFKAIIRYHGIPDNNDRKKKESSNYTAKLLLSIHENQQDLLIKEISLVGSLTTMKTTPVAVENVSENYRCDTPQHPGFFTSPTSPHGSASNRSGISGRNSPLSSASGGTVAGDVVSIRATHAALVWNSLKVGKSNTKEFTIRNTSNNKIKLQVTIVDNDKSFKFLRERHQLASNIVVSLQRMESRTFAVVFNPNTSGPMAGRIVFKNYEPRRIEGRESRPSKVIFLYGYGGFGKVEISEAFKDTGGQLWLSLGSLNTGGTLDAKIKLHNTGDLRSYAKVKLTPKAVYPAMVSSWNVEPTELLLGPKEVRWVTLEFRPRKEDLALLRRANVSHVGTLTITHGDEPTRFRIRRLYKKLSQNGQMSGKENEAFRNVVYPICKVFPGETPINNLNIIRDSVENLGDLCRGVLQHEVMLTMEVNAEETMSMLQDNADDSQTFYSLCSDSSLMFPATEDSFMPSETLLESAIEQNLYDEDLSVNPSMIMLRPPGVHEATILITTSSNVAQPFDTVLSHSEFLTVVPAEGMIPARRPFPIRVQCKKRIDHSISAVLQVYTENERRDVHIKVII